MATLADNVEFVMIVYTIIIATLSFGRTVGLDLLYKFRFLNACRLRLDPFTCGL